MHPAAILRERLRARTVARATTAGAVLLAAVVFGGNGGRARGIAEPAVRIVVQVLATPADGPTGKARAEVVRVRHVGERVTAFLGAGDHGDLLMVGAGQGAASVDGFDHRWEVEAGVAEAATDRIVLDVAWRRVGEAIAGSRTTVTLREDEEQVLDLVSADASGSAARNALVRISASLSSVVAAPLFEYELWLVDDSPAGQRVERVVANAHSGELLPYHFRPLHWSASGEAPAEASPASIRMQVGGGVRGRIQGDGTIDVELQTTRRFGWGNGETGGSGTKKFVVRPGETVAVQLPAAAGSASSPAVSQTLGALRGPGVTASGQDVRVDFAQFFAGHRTTVFLTVRDVR